MKSSHRIFAFVLCALLAVGCSKSTPNKPAPSTADQSKENAAPAEHTHGAGPNGGVVFDFGGHHAEFTVDHGKKECSIVVLGADEKTPTAVATTEIMLMTKETTTADGTAVAPMTITLKPADATNGKATKFIGIDPGLGNAADFAGSISGELDGKPAQGEFKE